MLVVPVSYTYADLYVTAPDSTKPVTIRYEVENNTDSESLFSLDMDEVLIYDKKHTKDEIIYSDEFKITFKNPKGKQCIHIGLYLQLANNVVLESPKIATITYSLWQDGQQFAKYKHRYAYIFESQYIFICQTY